MRSTGILIATLAGALMSVCVKLTAGHYHPWEIVLYNAGCATVVSFLILKLKGLAICSVCPKHELARGVLGVVSMGLSYWCLQVLPLATTVTFRYTAPIYTVFFAILISLYRRHKPPLMAACCVLMGFCGVLLILRPAFDNGTFTQMLISASAGPVIALIAILLHRMGELNEHPVRMLFYSSICCFLFGLVMTSTKGLSTHTLESGLLLAGICVFGLGNQFFVALGWSQGNLVLGAALQLCGVVFATVFGVILFGEKLDMMTVCGIGVIMLSVFSTAVVKSRSELQRTMAR